MKKWDFGNDNINENKNNNSVSFTYNPVNIRRTYGVVLISENEDNVRLQTHFKIDVISLTNEVKDNGFFNFEIYKHQVYINEKKPDGLVDELVEKCGKVLYPLHVETNKTGQVIRITNHSAILKRWQQEKNNILLSYKGKETESLLKNMDEILSNAEKTTSLLLQRDWFINIFFASIYNVPKSVGNIMLPFIPYALPISFSKKVTVTKHNHKKDDVVICCKGRCNETRSEEDILRGNLISIRKEKTPVKGSIDLTYQIYKGSAIADSIIGSSQVDFPSGKRKKMNIEIYHLKELEQPKTEEEKVAEVKDETEKVESSKKKKKKYFLFGKELKFSKSK